MTSLTAPRGTGTAVVATPRRSRSSAAVTISWVSLVVAVAGAVALSLTVGSRDVPLAAVTDTEHPLHYIVQARIPRTLLALLVGGALGLAGACMQGLTRNPLADPGILGINAGASLAMVVGLSFAGVTTMAGFVWWAFAGAAVAAVLGHGIASMGRGGPTPVKLTITGFALTAALTSWTSGILLTDLQTMDVFRYWQVGSVAGRPVEVLATGWPFVAVGAVLALASARTLDTLALGDDLARGLGRRAGRDRLVVGLAIVLLAGAACALAGPIAFAGLVVPHAVRIVVGPSYTRILPASLLAGAVLVAVADTVGRIVLPPTEVQVGIMTAVVGVPVFLLLMRTGRMGGL